MGSERNIGSKLELVTQIIEAMVFAALATSIVVGVAWVLAQIASMSTSIVSGKPYFEVNVKLVKDELLSILDSILLLIIGIDVLRTIVVSIVYRELYLVAAIEAAILAVVREIIGSEIRHRSVADMLGYTAIIVLLGALWLITQKEFVERRRRDGRERVKGGVEG